MAEVFWAVLAFGLSLTVMIGVLLRVHNARAEKMYGSLPGFQDSIDKIDAYLDDMRFRQASVADISEDIVESSRLSGQDLKARLPSLLRSISELVQRPVQLRVRILIRADNHLVPYAWYVPPGLEPFRNKPFALDYGAVGKAYSSGKPVIIHDISADDLFAQDHSSISAYQSVLCFPIPTTGPVSAVLNLDSPEIGVFKEEHLPALTACSNLLGLLFIHKFPALLDE